MYRDGEAFAIVQQLDRAAARNAALAVLLRHATAEIHQRDHGPAIRWTACDDPRCRRVATLLGEWRA